MGTKKPDEVSIYSGIEVKYISDTEETRDFFLSEVNFIIENNANYVNNRNKYTELLSSFNTFDITKQINIVLWLCENNIKKEVVDLFFKKIDLKKALKKIGEEWWDNIWKYINGEEYIKLRKTKNININNKNIKLILKKIKNTKLKKPYKNLNFLDEIKEDFDENTLKDFMEIRQYFTYRITRVFLELAIITKNEKIFFENEEYFNKSDFWFQQKILHLALTKKIIIKGSFLEKFFKELEKKVEKTSFQLELIELHKKNYK